LLKPIGVAGINPILEEGVFRVSTINVGPLERPLIHSSGESSRLSIPDLLERATGVVLLAAASPVIAVSALALAGLSKRSPLVAHLRVGRNNRPFWMWKLRTMWTPEDPREARDLWIEHVAADPLANGKDPHDSRVTSRFAAFCRRHSIDELPQLWHVARGEMSLVGPRPLTRTEVSLHYGEQAAELLSVKPGLTGLWQVNGRSSVQFPGRSAMDLELVRSLTPRKYVTILLRTLPVLISGKGAW
jgi:lipopolysaccharide/colanic/teichoic acid biosynthesis glycosyltransferase